MKKIFLILSLIILASCSSDDDNSVVIPDNVDGTLIKKAVYTNNSGQISTTEYTYSGNKLLKIESNSGSSTSYEYAGNLITKINFNFGSLTTESQWLTYDNNKLISMKKTILGDITYSVTYTDNADNSVTIKDYNGDFENGGTLVSESKAFVENGSVVKMEKYHSGGTLTYNYTYDDKFTPTAGITGYDKLRFYQVGATANAHNILSVTGAANVEMHYTYNAQNFASTVEEGTDGPTVKYYYY